MYCIKLKLPAGEYYVGDCCTNGICICNSKTDAVAFSASSAAKQYARDSGFEDVDFEVVGGTEESVVFSTNCVNSETVITFKRLHEICEEGSADLILNPGDKLENGYIVVAVESDAVKIWSPNVNLGNMNWKDANSAAGNYAAIWNNDNSELHVKALVSGLLSKAEVEAISLEDRTIGFYYWTATVGSSGSHWCVNSDCSLACCYDSNSSGCCPGIWVG